VPVDALLERGEFQDFVEGELTRLFDVPFDGETKITQIAQIGGGD